MPGRRGVEASEYRHLYKTARWERLRQATLMRDGYRCTEAGCGRLIVGSVAHVHHIKPHKGDRALFFDPDNVRLVCDDCHVGPIKRDELRGYSIAIGIDGFFIDPLSLHYRNR